MALSLLLLASITQGVQDVEVFHYEKVEAVVGQNVTLPCLLKKGTNFKIVNIEWRRTKHENEKLAVYNPSYGHHLFWPNITIQPEEDQGAYLHLHGVSKWDSGIYICDFTTFPNGVIRSETELKIKDVDVELMCDVNNTVEVHAGEDVTIHCSAFPNAQYRWTKNKTLVSENESLQLRWVTDAHAGVYTLTVNTGNRSLQREFIITVLTETTSLRTDLVTPQPNVTEGSLVSLTTWPTTGLSATDTNITWTTSTDVTDDPLNPSNATIPAGETTSFINHTHITVTSSPPTHTDPYHLSNSSYQEMNVTHRFETSTFSDHFFGPTQEIGNESVGSIMDNAGFTTRSTGKVKKEDKDTGGVRTHLFLMLIIIPVLLLIAVASFLCRREMIRQRFSKLGLFGAPSQEEDHYFHNLTNDEQEENPHNHHEQQENPIYGNISTDRGGSVEVCYEMMTMQHKKDHMKPSGPDLNYASLDLKVAKKHKRKYRHQQGGHTQLPAQSKALLDMDADMDTQLPPRDTSTMVSHSSIYLNSQQIAQETEEMERERGMNMERENVGWDGMRRWDNGGSRKWKDRQESEERKEILDVSNGSVCTQLSEVEAIQIGTDHFTSSFSHNSEQLD
ncbi:hypothetical protein L3Q82_022284 [Scortum barcoo]|uniref:Uncharacterized protein n=1 Tax=Scortum barcoo TaxID=214431 RepID=A0ACB8X0T4_9TELE|nr:hypothetical protein L3Q82_022284 [Scortum barcoo]